MHLPNDHRCRRSAPSWRRVVGKPSGSSPVFVSPWLTPPRPRSLAAACPSRNAATHACTRVFALAASCALRLPGRQSPATSLVQPWRRGLDWSPRGRWLVWGCDRPAAEASARSGRGGAASFSRWFMHPAGERSSERLGRAPGMSGGLSLGSLSLSRPSVPGQHTARAPG